MANYVWFMKHSGISSAKRYKAHKKPLVHIYNASLCNSKSNTSLLIIHGVKNYRHISNLSAFPKILEKLCKIR
jgi:hypothetical protein